MDKKYKQRLVDYKGGKCIRCGYSAYLGALELHHRDPEQKDFSFAAVQTYKFEVLKPELDKCDLLCANCHREVHEEQRQKNLPVKLPLRKSDDVRPKKKVYQPGSRKTKIDWPSPEVLAKMVIESSYVAVGKALGVSDRAVKKRCVSFGIAIPGLRGHRPASLANLGKNRWTLGTAVKTHGTCSGYARGCKCELCIEWCKLHWRKRRARTREQLQNPEKL